MPGGTSAGICDIAWGMFSEDKQKSYGLQVEPGFLTVTSTSASPALPAPPPQPSGTGPADAVRQHYAYINARNFPSAWGMLTPRFRSGLSYENWARGFETTRGVQTPSVAVSGQSGDTATVALTVISDDSTPTGQARKTFQGTWSVILVDGIWKLDSASIKQVD